MKITAVNGFNADCEARGVERKVSLFMLQQDEVQPGDYIMVHLGYAIQKIPQQEAQAAWDLYDEMLLREQQLSHQDKPS